MSFFVNALNLPQGDWNHTYGPFPGTPTLTHNFLCDSDGNHLFEHEDDWVFEDGWHATDDKPGDEPRSYGWRRCYNSPYSYAIAQGPYFTDLAISYTEENNETLFDNDITTAIPEHLANPFFDDWLDWFDPTLLDAAGLTVQPVPLVARTHR